MILYGPGMHNFVLDELELGEWVAIALDNEAAGWTALHDIQYEMELTEEPYVAPQDPWPDPDEANEGWVDPSWF